MSNYLNLNKDKIKKNVVCKLSALGYKVDEETSVKDIQKIVKIIQRDNGLMIDGYIGRRTMPLLGYSGEEIRKMFKLSKNRIFYYGNPTWFYRYPIWLWF